MKYTAESGIYFLIRDEKVVYIGHSSNVGAALARHSKNKNFDSYQLKEPKSTSHDDDIAACILELKPEYNTRIPKNKQFYSVAAIKAEGLPAAELQRRLKTCRPYPFGLYLYYEAAELRAKGLIS